MAKWISIEIWKLQHQSDRKDYHQDSINNQLACSSITSERIRRKSGKIFEFVNIHSASQFLTRSQTKMVKTDCQPRHVCPSHQKDFREISCWGFLLTSVNTLQFWFISNKNKTLYMNIYVRLYLDVYKISTRNTIYSSLRDKYRKDGTSPITRKVTAEKDAGENGRNTQLHCVGKMQFLNVTAGST
jgi:hypothetical protein